MNINPIIHRLTELLNEVGMGAYTPDGAEGDGLTGAGCLDVHNALLELEQWIYDVTCCTACGVERDTLLGCCQKCQEELQAQLVVCRQEKDSLQL